MKVYFLEGNSYDMGYKWGKLIDRATIDYFINEPAKVSYHMLQNKGFIAKLTSYLLENLATLVSRNVRQEDRDFLKGMGESLGLGSKVLKIFCYPDFFNYLFSKVSKIRRDGIPHVLMGCSSFVVFGKATSSGSLFHARNLDYVSGNRWTKNHAIVVIKPRGSLASVNVLSDGIYAPGITSINEKGIALSLHLNFTRKVRFLNVPILTIVSEIISKAEKLSDIFDIVRRKRPLSGWTIIASSAVEKDAVIFELNADSFRTLHPQRDYIFYTNRYVDMDMRRDEFAPSYIWVENNNYRYDTLERLIIERHGRIDEVLCYEIMSDTFDPGVDEHRALGHTISNAANISSALFCWEEDFVSVSDGPVPANRSRYVKYRLSSLFDGKEEILGYIDVNPTISESKMEAFFIFADGISYWDEELNAERFLYSLDRAIDIDDEEPLYFFLRALVLIKLNRYEQALYDLNKSLKFKLSTGYRGNVLLWKGRVLDLMGSRNEALQVYEEILRGSYSLDIKQKASHNYYFPYKASKKFDIIPFIADFADVL